MHPRAGVLIRETSANRARPRPSGASSESAPAAAISLLTSFFQELTECDAAGGHHPVRLREQTASRSSPRADRDSCLLPVLLRPHSLTDLLRPPVMTEGLIAKTRLLTPPWASARRSHEGRGGGPHASSHFLAAAGGGRGGGGAGTQGCKRAGGGGTCSAWS